MADTSSALCGSTSVDFIADSAAADVESKVGCFCLCYPNTDQFSRLYQQKEPQCPLIGSKGIRSYELCCNRLVPYVASYSSSPQTYIYNVYGVHT